MNFRHRQITILFTFFLFFTAGTHAQNQFDLHALQPGELILNLSATEQENVEQDTLNVNMQYSAQGRDSTALQNEVNKALRDAMNILEDTDNIDYSIQQYHVYNLPSDRPSRDNPVWRAQQGIQMQSMNSEALLVVTARLQQAGLTINNLNYSLSSERFETVSDSLMNGALRKLQDRADAVAATLNKSSAELVEVSINGGQNFFGNRNVMALEARISVADAMSVPVAEPGETQVSMTVSARALLSD